MSNDIVDLREENEDIALLSDADVEYAAAGRKEGRGFGGTLLAGQRDADEPGAATDGGCIACDAEAAWHGDAGGDVAAPRDGAGRERVR